MDARAVLGGHEFAECAASGQAQPVLRIVVGVEVGRADINLTAPLDAISGGFGRNDSLGLRGGCGCSFWLGTCFHAKCRKEEGDPERDADDHCAGDHCADDHCDHWMFHVDSPWTLLKSFGESSSLQPLRGASLAQ